MLEVGALLREATMPELIKFVYRNYLFSFCMVSAELNPVQLAKLLPPTQSNKNKLASFVTESGRHLSVKPQPP